VLVDGRSEEHRVGAEVEAARPGQVGVCSPSGAGRDGGFRPFDARRITDAVSRAAQEVGADDPGLSAEAAIVAVRAGPVVLSASDLREARDRFLLGRREGSGVLLPDEKHAVAVHESVHAIVAAVLPHADPVAKMTILPAGMGARRHRATPLRRTAPVQRRLHA
jgi:hypothetical protein